MSRTSPRKGVTDIRRLDGISIPWNTEHAVAAGLDDEFMETSLPSLRGDDVFDTTIASETTGYA
jgi:hypothetical protein